MARHASSLVCIICLAINESDLTSHGARMHANQAAIMHATYGASCRGLKNGSCRAEAPCLVSCCCHLHRQSKACRMPTVVLDDDVLFSPDIGTTTAKDAAGGTRYSTTLAHLLEPCAQGACTPLPAKLLDPWWRCQSRSAQPASDWRRF